MDMENFDFNNKLYVITESAISKGRGNEFIVKEAIKGGAKIIQLREKEWGKEQVKNEAVKLLKICKENNVLFIVNDYIDVAMEIGADGVHLGQSDMSIEEARKICGDKLIIGLSTHSVEQAVDADQEDVDYITIGPVYQTRAKDFTVGVEIIKPVVDNVDKPVIAVPTSVGYGTGFKGISALLTMLNSCAPGLGVVNIDNGFGAGYLASLINQLGEDEK